MKKLLSLMAISPMVITACGGASSKAAAQEEERRMTAIEYLNNLELSDISDYIHEDLMSSNSSSVNIANNSNAKSQSDIFRNLESATIFTDKIDSINGTEDIKYEIDVTSMIINGGNLENVLVYKAKDAKTGKIAYTLDEPEQFIEVKETSIELTDIENGYNFKHLIHKVSQNGEDWIEVPSEASSTEFSILKVGDNYSYGVEIFSGTSTDIMGNEVYKRELQYGSDSIIEYDKLDYYGGDLGYTTETVKSVIFKDGEDTIIKTDSNYKNKSKWFNMNMVKGAEDFVDDMEFFDFYNSMSPIEKSNSEYTNYIKTTYNTSGGGYELKISGTNIDINLETTRSCEEENVLINPASNVENQCDIDEETTVENFSITSEYIIASRNIDFNNLTDIQNIYNSLTSVGLTDVKVGTIDGYQFNEDASLTGNGQIYMNVGHMFYKMYSWNEIETNINQLDDATLYISQ